MSDDRTLRLYYNDDLLARAAEGAHNYTNRLRKAVESRDIRLELCRNSHAARALSATRPGYALFHMDAPFHARALTTRLAYFYPFWRIEHSAKRWEWEIATQEFLPSLIDAEEADRFVARQRRMQFPHLRPVSRAGYVYVPLQGKLLVHRSFQSMSPMDMLGETLAHSGRRPVVAGLHPKEKYSAAERHALDTLVAANPRFSLSNAPMSDVLASCDYVVTQNSSVALSGFLLDKPAILFARIDFHHIALNVARLGIAGAFARAEDHRPPFAAYLFWFLKATTINAGAANAESQILDMMRRRGWVF